MFFLVKYVKIMKDSYTGWFKIFCKRSLFRRLMAPLNTLAPRGAANDECHVTYARPWACVVEDESAWMKRDRVGRANVP